MIGSDGEQLGIVLGREAQRIAEEKNLDLVKIAPNSKPPVCKIMDFSKFKFEQAKKEREARRKQKTVDIKEVRLSINIDTNDINVKVRRAIDFLKNGDKVKVRVSFRYGREISRSDTALSILNDFATKVSEFGIVDRPPKMEGRSMVMFLAAKQSQAEKPPKSKKPKSKPQENQEQENPKEE